VVLSPVPPSLNPPRPASDRRRGVLRHLVDHHARHGEPELADRLVGVSRTMAVGASLSDHFKLGGAFRTSIHDRNARMRARMR